MDNSIFKKSTEKLVTQRNCFLFFAAILSIAVVFLATLLFFKNERTVIVPTSGPSFWIEDARVSSVYLEKMGLFLSDLLLNRTPADVERKNQIVLEHVHPAFYQEIRKILNQERETLLQGQQSFFFRTSRSFVDLPNQTFVIEGEFLILVGKMGETPFCAQHERKKFTLKFHCQNGKLLLTSLTKEALEHVLEK
jgi:type IV conjugative transfer system protein TraE